MSLARHVDPETLIGQLHGSDNKAHSHHVHTRNATSTLTPYSSRYNARDEISKFRIPQNGAPVRLFGPQSR
jgi:glutamate decarboxylase